MQWTVVTIAIGGGADGEGGLPLPCLHVVMGLCNPHHPRFALLPPPGGRAVRGDMRLAEGQEQEKTEGLGRAMDGMRPAARAGA